MVGSFSGAFPSLGSFFPRLLGERKVSQGGQPFSAVLGKKSVLHSSPLQFSGVVMGSLVSSRALELPSVDVTSPVYCMVASPPQKTKSATRAVVPEFCLAVPKTRKKRRGRGGGGGDDDDDSGGDGGDDGFSGWDGGGDGDEDEEDARRRWLMWLVLGMYSLGQTLYFIFFAKEEKASSPLLATVTLSLYARLHEKYLQRASAGHA